jgi:hypothetical protein
MRQIEHIIQYLAGDHIAYGAIPMIAGDTGIEPSTLRVWLQQPINQHDENWKLYEHRTSHCRALRDEQERELTDIIRTEFITQNGYCLPCNCEYNSASPKISIAGPSL